MYEYIKGKIKTVGNDYLVVDNSGIGYRIYTSDTTLIGLEAGDEEKTIYTYLHVREDIMQLYGFNDKEQLSIFIMLINISGIGPKVGLSLLSTLTPRAIAFAIVEENVKELSKAKGVGKKTAQRIILELKDKFRELEKKGIKVSGQMDEEQNVQADEAKTALMVLGYTRRQSQEAVNNCLAKSENLEDLIKKCLLYLNE